LPVLIQVELGDEATKSGVSEDELPYVVAAVRDCERLRLTGLMTLPPFLDDVELVRPYFRRLRELRDALKAQQAFGESAGDLSMGMSHDYSVAIEEGATFVRVGTAIFGERQAAAGNVE
jgi:pyridoxal phosphate enzyme (YggS family)